MIPNQDSLRFLEAIYADALGRSSGHLLIWTASPKRSAWFRDLGQAAEYAGRCAGDTYVGVGLSDKDYGAHARAKAHQIVHVPALWLDLDYLDDVHQHDDLPESEEEARQLIGDVGLDPTVVVHTGHGLQAWWRIDGGECETDSLRENLALTVRRWQQTQINGARARRNWRIDATHDLARLMRIPGTWNMKAEPVPVRILEGPHPIIIPIGLFIGQIEDAPSPAPNIPPPSAGPIILRPDAEPPSEKFSLLLKVERRFKGAWERTRADIGDRSPSGWDMALADIAVEAGWADQEIVNLIIASRRKYGDDLKLRQDYFALLLQKAHVLNGNLDQRIAAAEVDADTRDIRLTYVSEHLGITVHGMIRHPGPPASYRLQTDLGPIPIRTIEGLTSATKLRNLVADVARHVVPTMKPKRWDSVVQALLDVCEDDVIEDATEAGRVKEWLDVYITDAKIYGSPAAGIPLRRPFVSDAHDSRIGFFGDGLHLWLVQKRAEKLTKQEMSVLLRAYGCEQTKINADIEGKRTSRLIWLRPHPKDSEITQVRA